LITGPLVTGPDPQITGPTMINNHFPCGTRKYRPGLSWYGVAF